MTKNKLRFGTFDCESDPFKKGRLDIKPFIWGVYIDDNFTSFDNTVDMMEFCATIDAVFYAHFGGKFDFHFMLEHLKPNTRLRVINGHIAEFKYGNATFRDSFLILPAGLNKYQKQEFDYDKLEKEVRGFYSDEILDYLKSDCVNLYTWLDQYFDEYPRTLTFAGAAVKMHKRFGGKFDHTKNASFYDRFRKFYYGGRCQAFKGGIFTGDFKILDINSAYPKAMLEEHPSGYRYEITTMPKESDYFKSMFKINGETLGSIGCFPLREENGTLSFPVGKGIYHVTGYELIKALETNSFKIDHIVRAYVFKETVNFIDYVNYFYAKKLNAEMKGDKVGRMFAKFFLNSLYGKLAANPDKYENWLIDDWGNCPPGFNHGNVVGNMQLFSQPIAEHERNYHNVATGASITGYVRAMLFDALYHNPDTYYCDTDSVFVDGKYNNIELSDKIGGWSVEFEGDNLAIAGKKLYVLHDSETGKHKLASKGAKLSKLDIVRVANGEEVRYNPDSPTFSIKRGIYFNGRNIVKTI